MTYMKNKYYPNNIKKELWCDTWLCNNNKYRIQLITEDDWFKCNGWGMNANKSFKSYKRNNVEIFKQPYGGLITKIPKNILNLINETVESLTIDNKPSYVIITLVD